MDLNEYILQHTTGVAFAKLLGIAPPALSVWRNKIQAVPAHWCPEIEKETGGLVTCEELNDAVDWQYLRGTQKAA